MAGNKSSRTLSSTEASFFISFVLLLLLALDLGRGKNGSARGMPGRRKRGLLLPPFPSSHRSPRALHYSKISHREPLRRREVQENQKKCTKVGKKCTKEGRKSTKVEKRALKWEKVRKSGWMMTRKGQVLEPPPPSTPSSPVYGGWSHGNGGISPLLKVIP